MSSSDREKRKEQRRKELEEKKRRLKQLKDKKNDIAKPQELGAGGIDFGSISNVQDLLKTLEETSVVTKIATDTDEVSSVPSAAGELPQSPRRPSEPYTKEPPSPYAPPGAGVPPSSTLIKQPQLSVQLNVAVFDVAPKEVEVYSRATQTTDSWIGEIDEDAEVAQGEDEETTNMRRGRQASTRKTTTTAVSTATDVENVSVGTESTESKEGEEEIPKGPPPIPEIGDLEKQEILRSEDFVEFFSKASRTVERALNLGERFDILRDFTDDDKPRQGDFDAGQSLRLQTTLFDEQWSKYRSITDLSWCSKDSDLIAASYSANETGTSDDPDGVVCVWSIQNLLQRPESIFHCSSPVTSTMFAKYQPNVVIGGTYSGQIVLWDRRSPRKTPIQRTPLSSIGHTHPVYSLSVVGTQNASNLVTVSTDGRVCVWTFESLHQPLEVLELRNKQTKSVTGSGNIAPICVAFPEGEMNEFFLGSEEGLVYQAYRHGNKSGVYEQFIGHRGPVSALDFHPVHGPVDLSDCFLTSSLDWSIKLWSKKNTTGAIHSFEDIGDYVYDVAWSPVHPALFASVDGTGSLCLWNINEDPETPIVRTVVGNGKALSSLAWAPTGRKIIAGNSLGSIYVYDLSEQMAQAGPQEWTRMEEKVKDLAAQTHEPEEDII